MVTRYMSLGGIPCLSYLADYFVAGPDLDSCLSRQYSLCLSRQYSLLDTLSNMGFSVNYEKVSWPSRTPKYLGVIIDLLSMKFRLPKEKIDRTLSAVNTAINCSWYSRKNLERLTGLLAHCSTLVVCRHIVSSAC